MNILHINTSQVKEIHLVLETEQGKKELTVDSTKEKSQMLLPTIESFLQQESVPLSDLTALQIHTGPGSFTGLRVGAAVARTLSELLQIPINGMPPGSLPQLEYGEDTWKKIGE